MLKNFRAAIRLILFFFISFTGVLFVGLGNLTIGLFDHSLATQWKHFIITNWAKIITKIIGLKINKRGEPPNSPFFLVANHLSYIDVLPLWQYLDATFIAKKEIKSWPFFGWSTKILGVLFINRDSIFDVLRMNKKIGTVLSEQQGVVLFPEGTSTKGEQVLRFKAPLLKYPAHNKLPVHYATLSYRCNGDYWSAHQHICWWGDMSFFCHFWELLKIPGFEVDITFGNKSIMYSDRKELAANLQQAVAYNFKPVVKFT